MSKTCPCKQPGSSRGASAKFGRHLWLAAQWILPGSILALMPKCPLCFAAYFSLATGVGLSVGAAGTIRSAILWLCIGVCIWCALRLTKRWYVKTSRRNVHPIGTIHE